MLLKIKERVDLNNNGLSIESTARLFQEGKWVKRHILCKKPVDLSVPIFYIFKNKRDKQKNVAKISLVMNNYIGFESGFEHKKRRNTLSVLTAETCLLLSFDLAENLVIWEEWLKKICGKTVSFFTQLKKIPSNWKCTYALLKEVRCHIKESFLGVIYGRPQECILYVDLTKEAVDIDDHNLITIYPASYEESVVLLCPKAPIVRRCITAARIEGALPRLLNREQYEGDWIPRDEKKRSFGDQTSQLTVNISELASLMRTPEPTHNHRINPGRLGKGLSKSGYVFESTSGVHRPVSRANSTAAYYSTAAHNPYQANGGPILRGFDSVTYVNVDNGSNHYYNSSRRASATEHDVLSTKFSEPSLRSTDEPPIYCNIPMEEDECAVPEEPLYEELAAMQPSRSSSLPEYVNIQLSEAGPRVIEEAEPHRSHFIQMMSEKVRRRSDNSMNSNNNNNNNNGHHVYPSTSKGRSIPDFASAHYDEGNKHENWKRAKKFFSAFKPKSQSDLHHNNKKTKRHSNIIKSSSTSALQFSSSVSYFPRGSTGSETDDAPPQLNVSICGHMTRSQPMLSMEQPPVGLIQAPTDIQLVKRPRGVGGILARRKIRGSFTKYDGEKTTHMYQPQTTKEDAPGDQPTTAKTAPPRPPKSEKFDGIASAVNRGQEKLKMCDRRASNVSFHKVNINAELPTELGKQENKEGTSSRPLSRADSAGPRRQILAQLTNPRLSNSHSEYTRSSNESLSSDARSRISIRKKNNSPPRFAAPRLPPHIQSRNYVTIARLHPSSSVDSLNSEQTARSTTPPLVVPRRNPKGSSQHSLASAASNRTAFANYCDLELPQKVHSSSSSNSVVSNNSPTNYVLIDPVTTRAAHEASNQQPFERSRVKSSSMTGVTIVRRKSQGQGSSASDTMSVDAQPARQGFFKKYRKMRRARKNASSLSQLNL